LPAWSQQFPTYEFVFVNWEQTGWKTIYRGYICQAGAIKRELSGEQALSELMAALKVELGPKLYFPPLSHHFYW
jgi:hypothetical protein